MRQNFYQNCEFDEFDDNFATAVKYKVNSILGQIKFLFHSDKSNTMAQKGRSSGS